MGLGETIVWGPGWRQWELENGMDLRGLQVGELTDLVTASRGERRTVTERRSLSDFKISAWVPPGTGGGWPGLRSELLCPPLPGRGQAGSGGRFLLVFLSPSPQSGLS